jgi:outer membrane protein TolC
MDWLVRCWWTYLGVALTLAVPVAAQEILPKASPPVAFQAPPPAAGVQVLPINLPTALQLANAQAIDVAVASARIRVAAAQLDAARALWLPTIFNGASYFRHDGRIQDVTGNLFDTAKSSFMLGSGPYAVFAVSDALFAPLARRQVVAARDAELQTARNDSMLATAEAYFNVQQARGELAGALDTARRAEKVAERAAHLTEGLTAPVEAARVRTEYARRRQAVQTAYERWRVASAELIRVLRLDPTALVEPLEAPDLQVTLLAPDQPVDGLIPIALMQRPELASQQALVAAALELLRQERIRPLVPSILLRGASTTVTGTLAGGWFGGGLNSSLNNFGARGDFDVQMLWELRNLGFGNRALIHERRADYQVALLEKFRVQDRVAAEVARALAELQSAAARVKDAEDELKNALDSAQKNFEGLGQTRPVGNLFVLLIRPQEVVAAVQALAQAYNDYYGAIADYNRAEFRLYRALGQPAQLVNEQGIACPVVSSGDAPSAGTNSKR